MTRQLPTLEQALAYLKQEAYQVIDKPTYSRKCLLVILHYILELERHEKTDDNDWVDQ